MYSHLNFFVFSFQKVTSLNGRMESAPIATTKKTDLKAKISVLQVLISFPVKVSYLIFIHLYTCILSPENKDTIVLYYQNQVLKAKMKTAEEKHTESN